MPRAVPPTVLGLAWLACALLGCRTSGPLLPDEGDAERVLARATLARFTAAVAKRDFETAESLLAAPLRERYTPQTLARDFALDPLAGSRLENARQALAGPPARGARPLQYPLGNGGAVRFTREGPELKLAALE